MILLVHTHGENAVVALPEQHTGGETLPARTYRAEGVYLLLDSGHAHLDGFDAAELCKNPAWRLASPQESRDYQRGKRQAGTLLEAAPPAPAPSDPKPKPAGTYDALRS